MPSSIAHGLTAAAIGVALLPQKAPRRVWIAGVLSATLLDIDAIGRPFQRGDIAWLGGHRAFTHSLVFAMLLGITAAWTISSRAETPRHRIRVALFLILATAAHGILDAFTTYGAGIAFFSPFLHERYRAAWRPLANLKTEITWIWLPALALLAAMALWRRNRSQAAAAT